MVLMLIMGNETKFEGRFTMRTGNKSLKLNMALNAIKGMMSIIFPLITFPYVSRVLGVANLGRYNFANSIISYLVLFAGLGISTYAIREGARIRENTEELESFSSEMFSINIWSTIASYGLFFALLLLVPKLRDYKAILIIFSLQIVFKTIGVEWLYSIYEDYAYITIRSIAFQIVSIILLFVFVNDRGDTNKYALITVISGVGSNVLNYVRSRKYISIRFTYDIDWKKHLKPILVLFAMTATVVIYVSSDTTMLGFMIGDYAVGIYSVSTKVYTIVKTVLSSVLVVSIPRLSALLGQNDMEGFSDTSNDIYKTLITVVAPAIAGIIILRKEIVLLLSSTDFISATSSLALLSIALFFCMGAWFWGQCILVPYKRENIVFKVTVISALVNIILNLILIPFWRENAAALTTIIAEGLSFVWCGIEGRKIVGLQGLLMHYLKVALGCLVIFGIGLITHSCDFSYISNIIIIVPTSVILYGAIEIIVKNETIISILRGLKRKILR